MINMESIEIILEKLLYVAVVVFPISTLILINKVKKDNYRFVKDAVKNPILPDLNLNFFGILRREYIRITGKRVLVNLNKTSQYILVLCIALLFLVSIITELFRY